MLIIVLFCLKQVWMPGCLGLQKSLTRSFEFESSLVNLAIAVYDVDWTSGFDSESGDLPCALVPAHCGGEMVEGLNENDGVVGGQYEAMGKCLVVKCFAFLLKKWLTLVLSNSLLSHQCPASGMCLRRPLVQRLRVGLQQQLGPRLSRQQLAL